MSELGPAGAIPSSAAGAPLANIENAKSAQTSQVASNRTPRAAEVALTEQSTGAAEISDEYQGRQRGSADYHPPGTPDRQQDEETDSDEARSRKPSDPPTGRHVDLCG